ncbi:hypothetical protein PHMEG_00025319 [Phytophthora megakarya]|uniref:Uncharacterized protein n=1 Tax=Phytophthora megakarya TaxID=4795 RepID=A0A225VEV3_9STRA|nr:hypothetical protein PHMEG_00025319 [Phytophthora megakarya]
MAKVKYATLPVSGNKHRSLMVVEAPMTPKIELYHVHSSTTEHDPAYAFKAVKWAILTHIVATSTKPNSLKVNTHRYKTTPQQSNRSDTGVIVMMAVYRIASFIAIEKPKSLLPHSTILQKGSIPSKVADRRAAIIKSSKWGTARSKGRSESSETKASKFLTYSTSSECAFLSS